MSTRLVSEGRSPAEWVASFAARGIAISERTLRERARELGACRILGHAMLILPEHIDMIFEAPQCHSNSTSAATSTGSVDALLTATDMSARALAHLTPPSRKPPSGRSKLIMREDEYERRRNPPKPRRLLRVGSHYVYLGPNKKVAMSYAEAKAAFAEVARLQREVDAECAYSKATGLGDHAKVDRLLGEIAKLEGRS